MTTEPTRYLHLVRTDCPLPPGTHVVIYCRDSGGEEQDRSVTQQLEAAKEYCQHHHLIVDRTYLDEARQSSNTDKREQLQEMLFDLRQQFKQINDRYRRQALVTERPFGVIFWKSNRLGRDSVEATNIKTDLRLRAITIIDLVTSANTGNAGIDALIEAFQQWQDEQALDEISQNVRRGLAQLVAIRDTDHEFLEYNPGWQSTGAYLGLKPGAVPRGFKGEQIQIGVYKRRRGRNTGEARVVQRIVPDPDMWDRCRRAWEMRRGGASFDEIHKETHLFRNINGYDSFFGNPIYTGDLYFGDKVYENFVPALIPREWFQEEQAKRSERRQKMNSEPMSPMLEPMRLGAGHLLSGLTFCGHIDGHEHPMHCESIPAKAGRRGNYRFFICTVMKSSRGQACGARRLSMRSLDQTVIDSLLNHVLTMENLRPMARDLYKTLVKRSTDAESRIGGIEMRLAEVRKAMANIMDALERMGYAPHLQQRYDERLQEEQDLVRELKSIRRLQITPRQLMRISDETLQGWLEYLRDALTGEDRKLARRLILQFVAKIVVKEGTGTIHYTFPFPDEQYMPSGQNLGLVVRIMNFRHDIRRQISSFN